MTEIDWVRLHYLLSDLEVSERWYDAASSLCLVLLSVPSGGITEYKGATL